MGSEDIAELNDADMSDAALDQYFGPAIGTLRNFASMLAAEGETRGLIGPREVPRLWTRHILNCAAVVTCLPDHGVIADVGSGAGLPGIVVAAMRPNAKVVLIESMDRRCAWLEECRSALKLDNVEVIRARAEELRGVITCDAVTARAVAALPKLAQLCLPLVRVGGELVALKGRQADSEVAAAQSALKKLGADSVQVVEVATLPGIEMARVVRVRRGRK